MVQHLVRLTRGHERREALHQYVFVNLQFQHGIDRDAAFLQKRIQSFCLAERAGEPIKQHAPLAIRLLQPPFDKRDIQLARRRLAKQWHPDIAPPGKQLEHERHLKAVNEAADYVALTDELLTESKANLDGATPVEAPEE